MTQQRADYPLDYTNGIHKDADQTAKEKLRDVAESAGDQLKSAADTAQEYAGKVADQAREYGEKAQEAVREFKPFGVSLAFTPTVLADGVINLVVQPEVSSIDPSASVTINNLTIPGLQTRRAKTVLEIRDGESFAMAGLLRKDFQDTLRKVPLLGSLPIIGALFRSTGFQHEETELVIIVTPRLVRPVPAGTLKVPTDRVGPPNEADLLINGRTDTGVPPSARPFVQPPAPPPPRPPAAAASPVGGMAQKKPIGFEKDYGHVL